MKLNALENSKQDNNGLKLVPEKNTRFEPGTEDSLVVLAECEL